MVELSPLACRVIGALLEKERTVPATYPLTPKAVVSACNQTTGRDPIMSITESQVDLAIRELREAKFARTVHASHGARTEKYRQVLDEALGLDSAERAVITLLLLRGAQTPGELRSRSDRLHTFGSADEVDASLAALAAREEPLVRQLDRRPGQKEQRWIHLLGSEADRAAQIGRDASASSTTVSAIPSTPVPSAPPPPLAPELFPLARFVGIWVGTGDDPDVGSFFETISLVPVDRTASLAYRSTSTDDGTVLHDESGFLRSLGDGSVELVVAHISGAAEVSEGLVDDRELILNSTTVAGTRTSAVIGGIDRRYVVDRNTLTYELSTSSAVPTSGRRRTGTLTRQD
jgi:uncharacterized protein YceH (UPF0502 family)